MLSAFTSSAERRAPIMLHYLSYLAILAAFAFTTLSLASGLLYISELIEEHSRLAKSVGQRGTYAIIALHFVLYFTDSLPLLQTLFSITCHIVYLQHFSNQWPLISLSSASFIASCAMAITNHFLWFMYFSRLARDAKQSYSKYRSPAADIPGFTDTATFFGVCVWLVPLFLFLSLSANDNALPTSSSVTNSAFAASTSGGSQSKSSLFKSMFSMISKDKSLDKTNGLIAPQLVKPIMSDTSPFLPSPTSPVHPPFLPPPPSSPRRHVSQSGTDAPSSQRIQLARRSPQIIGKSGGDAVLSCRQPSSRHSFVDDT